VITIRITAFNGVPTVPEQATFGDAGGTIGRADGNTLVLEDPQKTISRTHARVFSAAGRWMIEDLGSATPVLVNNRPLGNGGQAPIDHGDVVVIGGYTLQVIGEPGFAAQPPPAAGRPKDDPLALFGGGSTGGADPFADLVPSKPPARAAAQAQSKPSAPAKSASAIPDDFDPFGSPPAPAPDPLGASNAPLPHDFDLGFGASGTTPSVDELFDLKPAAGSDPFGSNHPLGEPFGKAATGPSVDPLVAMGGAKARDPNARPAQRDDVPELHGSFLAPEARPDPTADKSMLVSWEDEARSKIKTVVIPSPARPGKEPAQPAPPPRAAPAAAPRPAPSAPRERPVAPPADEQLLRAFLVGAGVPEVQIPGGLTPQLMQVFGELLRTATQGTLELLVARALTKREVQAPVTMISARENNPLKFSPTVEVAMQHLLAPQGKGFMSPPRAMKDAYDDLRAHQFGVVAGTRAALAGVLARFDPDALEKRLTQRSMLDTLLPMNRKSALWELFVKLYADIAREAEEDFHTLFGREFLKAYEAQIAKLERQQDKAGK
jgi:FHA domain-containing protein